MSFEPVIGLEIHAQLSTESKMFCPCPANYAGSEPNTVVCPICLGMPGVLPVINKKAVENAIMTALALNCKISQHTRFDRKNYPYPDLVKGYQISQYDEPIGRDGWLEINERRIRIQRVHLEEDTAKLVHITSPEGESYSLVDANRAGVPLLEIVTYPDIRSPDEAREFLIKLRNILQFLGVSRASMEEGSFRCDANISLRPKDDPRLPPKVEIKNMNSFKAVYQALSYEIERQKGILLSGGKIYQETRGWVEEKEITIPQRTKEYAHDYRYFPDPDLPPLFISPEWLEQIRSRMPELPDQLRSRFINQYGLREYDAALLTSSKEIADFFLSCVGCGGQAREVANWILGDLSHLLNISGKSVWQTGVKPENLVRLIRLLEEGRVSRPAAKKIFERMFYTGMDPERIMIEEGLEQISEAEHLHLLALKVIEENKKAVADYKKGKKQALTFLIGQVMRMTKGKANPQIARQELERILESTSQ